MREENIGRLLLGKTDIIIIDLVNMARFEQSVDNYSVLKWITSAFRIRFLDLYLNSFVTASEIVALFLIFFLSLDIVANRQMFHRSRLKPIRSNLNYLSISFTGSLVETCQLRVGVDYLCYPNIQF